MNKHIIHIPHSSLYLPEEFWDYVILDKETINSENIFLCDQLVDTFVPNDYTNVVKFPYSRMFLDVERFRDDEIESMSKLGMGAVYTKDTNSNRFIEFPITYKERLLKEIYDPYHKELEDKVTKILKLYNACHIIDLHSFSDELVYKLFKKTDNPDICIGVEEKFTDPLELEYTINYFNNLGFTTKINYPYKGSLIPTKYFFNSDTRVKSIMIEINKRIYLENLKQYEEFKTIMNDYLTNIPKLTMTKKN